MGEFPGKELNFGIRGSRSHALDSRLESGLKWPVLFDPVAIRGGVCFGEELKRRSLRRLWVGFWLVMIGAFLVLGLAPGGDVRMSAGPVGVSKRNPPTFYLIERFLKDQVLVHFDTEENRTYELQYADADAVGGMSGWAALKWNSLFVAESLPFPNHYIVVDSATNRVRFYRIVATP